MRVRPGFLSRRAIRFLPWVALFLVVLGVRLWMVDELGSSLPILDEWNGQGTDLLKPWVEGTLRFAHLFNPHNEHRIVLSRILTLGLFWLNGQWDSRIALVVDATVFASLAIAVATALRTLFGSRSSVLIFSSVALWSALPYAYENTLWGFQSAFYLLLCFSFLGLWGAGLHPAGSRWWMVGMGAALLACLSVASGFLAPVALVLLGALKLAKKRSSFQNFWITAAVSFGMIALSLYFRVTVPQHEVLKAASVSAWFAAFGRALAWPFSGPPFAALAMYSPAIALLIFYCWKRRTALDQEHSRSAEALLGVAFWVVLQAGAIAYGRGGDGLHSPGSRHMDLLAPGALVNLFAVVTLLRAHRQSAWIWRGGNLAGTAWMIWVLYGVISTSHDQFTQCLARHGGIRIDEENVRAYVASGERGYLKRSSSPLLPFPDPAYFAMLLDDSTIRQILPAVVRPPLQIEKERDLGNCFVLGGYPREIRDGPNERRWGSFSEAGASGRGEMESATIKPRLPYLEFEIAGYIRAGMSLAVRDNQNGKERRVVPTTRTNHDWRRARVSVSGGPLRIVARDENMEEWFAFGEPRELGRFSYYSELFASKGRAIFSCGLALCLFLVFQNVLRETVRKRDRNARAIRPQVILETM